MTDKAERNTDVVEDISPIKGKRMIAVTSGAQNIGKTFFAYNLCHALSLFKKKGYIF